MKKAFPIITAFCFLTVAISAQDISGFWKGSFNMQGCFPNNNIELQVSTTNGLVIGDSYHFKDINDYVKKKFTAEYFPSQKKLVVQEGMVTTYHIPRRCVICIKKFDLVYSREGNTETLRGTWSGNVLNSSAPCGTDSIILTRVKESAFKDIPEIKVDTGTLRLDFYDNAIVDDDTITVLVDDKVVFSHRRLTAKPLTTFVRIDLANTFHEVEMIAENLGSIPPNTAILVVTAGENRHRLTLNSTEVKSARVRFVYDPKDKNTTDPPKYSLR